MLAIERVEKIMQILTENGSAMVGDLSRRFGVSEETIRRDFEKLEKEKRIRRVHGGAYLINDYVRDVPSELRKRFFVEEKQRIARCCCELVDDWDSIMLDNSTTSLFICRQIIALRKNVSILTNSLDIVNELVDNDYIKTTVIGGVLNSSTRSLNGHVSSDEMRKYFANKCFISCTAVHAEFGITDNDEAQAKLREQMVNNSQTSILAVDHTKLDKVAGVGIAPIKSLHCVITDRQVSKEWKQLLERASIKLIIAE